MRVGRPVPEADEPRLAVISQQLPGLVASYPAIVSNGRRVKLEQVTMTPVSIAVSAAGSRISFATTLDTMRSREDCLFSTSFHAAFERR